MEAKAGQEKADEKTEGESREIAYEEKGSQALYSIKMNDEGLKVTFFEEDEVLEFDTLEEILETDLSTFEREEEVKEKVKEILKELNKFVKRQYLWDDMNTYYCEDCDTWVED